ncbi:MAG TPA: xanthine dehydrogenase family protein molybdopterin-binding subunit [Zoogloea sp.]|uniref:xanthine dehydrogenase family protein molybdopterin-binding subunit n=1 Tax=Zoogloea sp. TaxID=49181 RepID=UPI002BEA387A|nr:xanthine dehydrogenase family protein molybdopterin-binding subunit [Zoogloea sp.]HMV63246.1 xanthine dehydrogenase family protein molybdopterin-binding subunit [Rhodocyclaceae bacterium]HNC78134.1 xanthine dehydrogenase family protein molybdopterin-binding subunit [Rhodocyclaceae bacterium]HNF62487.1 xanthine dehydrogenase family protein molybdopterin-binding subunit [Rhodocyclaceae bacterium]HNH16845.1 xanthine dehydrogenase family protein molybdopterin-binding subunit [Zoogloea sp.]HNI47
MSHSIHNVSRRQFLQGAAGLSLGLALPAFGARIEAGPGKAGMMVGEAAFEPNAFLRIGVDNSVTVISKHLEMGQGTYTGLATLVAEELDAAWSQVKVEGAPADAKRYNNLFWGPAQGTGGSTAMANSWEQMRKAGAAARAMLVNAAAKRWSVPAGEITVRDGLIQHAPSRRSAGFGEMAVAAGAEAVPASVTLKDPRDFRLIGRQAPRKDSAAKTNGTAQFTQDLHLPDMLVAVVAHPPRFGATVKSVDAKAARAVKGVVDVVTIPTGVAVLARTTWSARKGRDALKVDWDESAAFRLGSDEILARYRDLARTPGLVARKEGDVGAALAGARKVITADYDFPYLAHAAMEPMNCVVQRTAAGVEVWNGEQLHTGDQHALAALFGVAVDDVNIHMLYAGGSFGRRACKDSDYVREAASIVKAAGTQAPVKLVWFREDDMRAGYYRPLFHHRLEAAVDEGGRIVAWRHRLVGQSIIKGSPFESFLIKDGIDAVSVEGAATLPYAIPHLQVELHTPSDINVPVLWWRSVGSTHTAYSTETFLDRLAASAGQDPVALRLHLLEKHPRHAAVLRLAADKAGWGTPLAAGKPGERRGRGVAVHESFHSFVAQVAEVTVAADGSVKVDRIVAAVDCGVAINPDNVRAQVEGSVAFALSAALHGEITLQEGRVVQSNFHDYAPLRLNEMPRVEVHIVPSAANPTGIGEPGVPPVAPAVANAIAAATGTWLTRLPFNADALKA